MINKSNFTYEIQYAKAADKFFKNHEKVRTQYEDSINELLCGENPNNIDVKKIKGKHNDYFRIRLGDYRVIYTIINRKIIVISTLLAGSRGDIYKKMDGLK
jgi:mRNA interferase RelE/StbE